MKYFLIILRLLISLLFVYAGVEKLFLPYDPSVFKANQELADPLFFEFYNLLQNAGFLFFVGVCQMICGILLFFRKTHILGFVMLFPLILCLWMVHIFISKYTPYIIFDGVILMITCFFIIRHLWIKKSGLTLSLID